MAIPQLFIFISKPLRQKTFKMSASGLMSVGSKNRLGFTQSDISTRHDVLKALVASL